jgi:hypothetical protein
MGFVITAYDYFVMSDLSFHGGDYEESSSGMWRRVVLVGTDFSEEHIASIFRAKTINELQTL